MKAYNQKIYSDFEVIMSVLICRMQRMFIEPVGIDVFPRQGRTSAAADVGEECMHILFQKMGHICTSKSSGKKKAIFTTATWGMKFNGF